MPIGWRQSTCTVVQVTVNDLALSLLLRCIRVFTESRVTLMITVYYHCAWRIRLKYLYSLILQQSSISAGKGNRARVIAHQQKYKKREGERGSEIMTEQGWCGWRKGWHMGQCVAFVIREERNVSEEEHINCWFIIFPYFLQCLLTFAHSYTFPLHNKVAFY